MQAVDYRITDAVADPPGKSEQWHTEQLVRLPDTFLCYQPPEAPPLSMSLPCRRNKFITLASFNNFAKVSPTILDCWREILARIPDARLLLKSEVFADPGVCRRLVEKLGFPEDRILLIGKTPDRNAHMAMYDQVDIALDTFPYNGTTTTCEALYMGVPVVTLAGQTHAARVGASLLGTVGLADLVADTVSGYVETVIGLSRDLPRLLWLRQNIRGMMATSPLMDQCAFTAALEAAYRQMWQWQGGGAQGLAR
jgi:predicted O-linked N-acetylglucosamine transferase (SPINDLY family)